MDPDSKRLRIAVTDGQGRPVRVGGLARWLASVAPSRAAGDVAIALVSDRRVRALNRQYRRQDKPTDVLAFPATPRPRTPKPAPRIPDPGPRIPDPGSRLLGDIVIATGVARRQAADAGHAYTDELRVLALHGLLHLLGYDHHDANDRGRMARMEGRLRRQGGLASGLIERAARRRTRGTSR